MLTKWWLPQWLNNNLPAITGDVGDARFDPWVGKVPWRKKWQPTPVFLPGETHGQRNLVGYSPWSHRVGHDLQQLNGSYHYNS